VSRVHEEVHGKLPKTYIISVNYAADSLPTCSDMANIDVEWEVEGILTPQESVEKMLVVIPEKKIEDTGTFWTWEGQVRIKSACSTLQHIFRVL
jgi:hypothetical protein